jgi:hypothetical protein
MSCEFSFIGDIYHFALKEWQSSPIVECKDLIDYCSAQRKNINAAKIGLMAPLEFELQ